MKDYKPDWDSDELGDDLDPVAREAAVWFGIMHADEIPKSAEVEFRAWLRRSPEHVEAYADIERIWNGAVDLPEVKEHRRAIRRAMTRRTFVIGGLTLGAGGASLAFLRTHPFAEMRTGTGERRLVNLPDGSTAEMSTRTVMSLDFTPDLRLVHLLEGEAFFSVAADATRPFVVEAHNGRTRALGTAFSVAHQSSGILVTVTEHAVDVRIGGQAAEVGQGNQIYYDAGSLGPVVPATLETSLAWRDGRLVFVSQPFGRVVEALNNWRDGQLVVMDQTLLRRDVTVIVDLEKSGDILDQLQDALPIRVVGVTPLLTLIFAA